MEFLHANGTRHIALLMGLMEQAVQDGSVPKTMPPMQRVSFLMGSVVAPMVIVPRVMQLGVVPHFWSPVFRTTCSATLALPNVWTTRCGR